MKKRDLYSIIIAFILIGFLIGIFYWQGSQEITGSPDDYMIKETEQGIFVENKRAGLTVKAPDGWEVEKLDINNGLIIFYFPGTEGERKEELVTPPLNNGCMIHTNVVYQEIDIEGLKIEAAYNLALLNATSREFNEIVVNNYPALEIIAETEKTGPTIGIDIPYKNKVYSFLLIFSLNHQNNCEQQFNNFLNNIVIK